VWARRSEPWPATTDLKNWHKKEKAPVYRVSFVISDRESPIEKLLRRLITLIFAGRNRIMVIRRELSRSSCASLAKRLLQNNSSSKFDLVS
jgi:hypothetical protein